MGPKTLTNQPKSEAALSSEQIKVKVTHVLLTNFDALCYAGELPVAYPKTLGRHAVGIVTECGDKVYGVEKGARVYLKGTRPCGKCLHCKHGDAENCEHVQIAGIDFDGFMRDFVTCDYRNAAVLPDELDDVSALCVEHVACAENIYDQLALPSGSKVGIVGGNALALIFAQVAAYHKLIPVVIDDSSAAVDKLQRLGVYYSVLDDENLDRSVAEATSGMGCDAAIYIPSSKISPDVAARVLARDKTLVLEGMASLRFKLDSIPLFRHNTKVITVTDGYGYDEAAINMILRGAVDLSVFEKQVLTEFDPAELLSARLADVAHGTKMTILKLIF